MKISVVVLFAFCCFFICNGQDDCIFNPRSIKEDFLRQIPDISHYEWDNIDKEARVITKNGDFIYVKKWACNSYGMESKKIIVNPGFGVKSINLWSKEVKLFASQLLDSSNYQSLENYLSENDVIIDSMIGDRRIELDIPHESYSEFLIVIDGGPDALIISISYYMN